MLIILDVFRSERPGVREMPTLEHDREEQQVVQCCGVANQQGGCCQGYAAQPLQQGVSLRQVIVYLGN